MLALLSSGKIYIQYAYLQYRIVRIKTLWQGRRGYVYDVQKWEGECPRRGNVRVSGTVQYSQYGVVTLVVDRQLALRTTDHQRTCLAA